MMALLLYNENLTITQWQRTPKPWVQILPVPLDIHMALGKVFNFCRPQNSYLLIKDNYAYFIRLFWRLNEIMHIKFLAQSLVYSVA